MLDFLGEDKLLFRVIDICAFFRFASQSEKLMYAVGCTIYVV